MNPLNSPFSVFLHVFAWIVTCLVVVVLGFLPLLLPDEGDGGGGSISINDELAGRMIYGVSEQGFPGGMLMMQLEPLRTGDLNQRLAYSIILSELVSPEAGIEQLEKINDSIDEIPGGESEAGQELAELVGILMFASASGEEADALPEERRAQLEQMLGFYGELLHARATGDDEQFQEIRSKAMRGAIGIMVIGGWFTLSFLAGVVTLLVMLILCILKRVATRFVVAKTGGSIYMETFAIWMIMHFGLQVVAALLAPKSMGTTGILLFSMIAMFLSLGALAWPLIRGVKAGTFLRETGLYTGNIFVEFLAGLATYAMALPILMVGVLLSAILGVIVTALFGEIPPPEHPIQGAITGSFAGIFMIYMVACVAAPIVEEIMFRGVLYGYLRNGTRVMGFVLSFVVSALVSSFIFAAIHPQGITFIPVLGSLAVAFCIGREWRGSLVAPMVAHALNNGAVMTLNVLLLA